ncbi:hypothetical protein WUBG_14606, partial [Wuchereria bancrofti]
MFLDDELITSTSSNWLFGPDNSGDVLKWTSEYISGIAKKVGKFSLITADGSVYCQDNPAEQERIIFPLLQKEIDISLSLLQTNGTFIVKMYTAFLNDTVTLLNRLLMCFHEETIPSDHIDDWRRHTSFTHPLRSFIRKHAKSAYSTEYSTQAFFKFYEIL